MGRNYYVYLKDTAMFSAAAFEDYCGRLGLQVQVHPGFDFEKSSGFLPMHLTDGRFGKVGDFLSGFEFWLMDCPKITPARKKLTDLFRKKAPPVEESDFERVVRDSQWVADLRCSGADSFEVLLAYAFGAYLVGELGGVFIDHQTGAYYTPTSPMEDAIQQIIAQLRTDASAGALQPHNFTGWL